MTTRYLMSDRKEKAMNRFGAGGYKKGGHVTEIAIMMGMPKGMKKSGMGCHKSPMRKAFGGPMDAEAPQVEQNIDQANQMLQKGIGLKKGGAARPRHFKHRMCKADGGPIGLTQMANRDFKAGKSALGLKMGGDVRMAAGGAGKIRKHVMSKAGKPLPTSFAKKHAKDL
jgi:hypothetical protein